MQFSNRISNMDFSPIRKLSKFAKETEKRGIKVYHLNIGQPDVKTPDTFFEGVTNYNENIVKYCDSQGIDSLIESFIQSLSDSNIYFDKDELMITHGGSEAIQFALMAICDPGDEVISPEPFYSNYSSFAKIAGAEIVPVETKIENEFHLPGEDLIESKITNRTKCILISNPCNPTGTVYSYEELEMLARIAKKYDLFIISDEVYRQFIFDNISYTSCMHLSDILDRVILVDSISKHYSACGARIGLVASKNKELMHNILKLCQARLCVSTIEQFAASNLINTMNSYITDVKMQYKKRRDIMYTAMSNIPGVVCSKPEGAFYMLAKLPVDDSDNFARWLLEDFSYNNHTLMFAPASGFYATRGLGKNEARFSYCTSIEDIKNSMIILENALEKYNKISKVKILDLAEQ
ncbi:pyridoxal phosphate-dependent aminotransferase [Clostridium tyrobutyricum]|uniref:pyridoxal phosphate-dependent aminotransferase n=1 Tax=Clostridium tyrobutyricum TaxID=1519 RepID=UPI00189D10B0|nr:pyridoxal phosphate-dependent aminotransferase [Clostridium tyrobutyricum]MBV4427318.1 pyridoxal phosphate-dependent aminotransferase [Clostridium tyrobutyricum]MBV4442347.1 pyridoxal phosphate-dependent aminotransferase [Clostridium tyrobutyricum]MBV4446354.1 pyridoxal phosphate-dependent aminotransferase [Clostridium tyrobutyricum]